MSGRTDLLRRCVRIMVAVAPMLASVPHAAAGGAPPTAEMVQVLLAGKAGVPRDFDPAGLFPSGDYLYAVGPYRQPSIHWFRRDASSGLLAYAGSVEVVKQQCNNTSAALAGGRLYVLLIRWVESGVQQPPGVVRP